MGECVICALNTSGSLDFCKKCWPRYKEEIKNKEPWTKELKNSAQRERKRRNREYDNVSLDALMELPYKDRR